MQSIHFLARPLRIHPAWFLAPLGLLGCIVIGLAQGWLQSVYVPVLVLGAMMGAAWMVVVIMRPEWALLFYAFAGVNLNGIDLPVPIGGLRLSPDIVLSSLLIAGMLFRLLTTRQPLGRLPITVPYLIFLAVPFITLISSPVLFQSIKGAFRFVGYYALIWLIVDVIRTPQQVMRMVTAIMLSPVIPVAIGFYQLATGGGQTIWAGESFNRVYGLAGGPFTLAFYLVLIIPLLLVFFLARPAQAGSAEDWPAQAGAVGDRPEPSKMAGDRPVQGDFVAGKPQPGTGQLGLDGSAEVALHQPIYRNRIVLGALLAGSMITLLLTFIRGSWLSLAAAVILLGALRYRKLLIAFPITMAGLIWAYAPAQSRLAETLDPNSTLFGRLRLWDFAIEWIATSPLVGVGMKAFEYYYVLLAAPLTATGLDRREKFLVGQRPHNEIIGYLLDVGLIGTVALLAVLFIVLRTAIQIYRHGPVETMRLYALAFLISSTGMLIGALGDNVFSQPTVAVYFWMMAGLILAIDRHMMDAAPAPGSQETPRFRGT